MGRNHLYRILRAPVQVGFSSCHRWLKRKDDVKTSKNTQVDQNLPLIEPPMMTNITTVMLTKVKMLVKTADERTPNPKRTVMNVKYMNKAKQTRET